MAIYSQNNDHAGTLKLNKLNERSAITGKGISTIELKKIINSLPALDTLALLLKGSNKKSVKPKLNLV